MTDPRKEFKEKFREMAAKYHSHDDKSKTEDEFFNWLAERWEPQLPRLTKAQKAQWDSGGAEQGRR